ncbi:MAG TPA: helical backbone metal receptor [Spirochaetota bacterium]|nr:helical backbone metal receptor [Spirochaetota bacterium]HPS86580.1 helical backbone metal receptor [Spirochaetota bacterium]
MAYRPVISYYLIIFFAVLVFQGCGKHSPQNENISGKRIISLSPSITGQIIDLGAEDNIVGVTPYHPPLKREVPLVGTYITPSIEKIISLKPDIIFMSEEDGEIQRNNFFEKFGLKYYRFGRNSDFKSICDNYYLLGEMIGERDSAVKKIHYYRKRLNDVKKETSGLKVAFLVSVKPLITVSKLSHISDIIIEAGGINVFANLDNPYPILTLESLIIKNPDAVIIMSPGEDRYLYHQLKNFNNIDFIKKKNIFVAGDDIIPYYSPKEYVLSVEKISEILSHVNK